MPQYPRAAFEASRALQSVRLSPDGRHVAYLRQLGQQRSLWLLPTAGGAARQLLPRTEAEALYWSRDGRWLFAKTARRTLVTLEIGGRGGMRIALDNPRGMLRVDPSQPAAVVLRERVRTPTGDLWRVVRRDARGKRTLLWEDQRFIHDVALDARGRLVALMRFDGDHDALYRVDDNGRLREVLRCTLAADAGPSGVQCGQACAFGIAFDRAALCMRQMFGQPCMALCQGLRVGHYHFHAFE